LQSNGFNTRAYFKSARGEMFFGGVNGFNAFFPQQIKENSHRPPIVITAFKKLNQIVQTDMTGGQEIELSYTDEFISFEFAALDYAAPRKNQYAYMLEGQDKDWVDAGTRRHVDYTNLRGGRYVFRVKGSNNHGVWNEEGAAIHITVTPPFWEMWWFRGSIGLVLAGMVIGGYQLRVRRIRARSRELETQVKVRTSQLQQRTQELEQRTTELGVLYEADEKLYRHLHLDQLLQTLVDTAVDILQADKGSLLVWDDKQERLNVVAAHGFSPQTMAQMSFAPDEGTIGLVATTGEPAIVEDSRTDKRVAKRITEAEGIRSFMHVPIKIGGRVFGVFNVDYLQPRAFGTDEQRLFIALSQRAALAIENAQLYEQVEQAAVLEERQRLARELHDSVSQALYGIVLGTRTARTLLDRESVNEEAKTKLANPLDYVLSLADAGLAEMRALIFELRPDALKTEGLVSALDRMVSAQRARHNLEIEPALCQEPELTLAAKEALYRIAQEALNNIVKHAHAKRVEVRLYEQAGWVRLEVQDDGAGFDPQRDYPGHMGLQSMRERAERLGGALEISSTLEQGTLLRARVPVSRPR
jgi:signal transduction histidine kinase